jgi:hypothetical protein
MRMAVAHPEKVEAIIIQNAVSHEEGLSPLWAARRAFWQDRASHEAAFRKKFLSLDKPKGQTVAVHWNAEVSFACPKRCKTKHPTMKALMIFLHILRVKEKPSGFCQTMMDSSATCFLGGVHRRNKTYNAAPPGSQVIFATVIFAACCAKVFASR